MTDLPTTQAHISTRLATPAKRAFMGSPVHKIARVAGREAATAPKTAAGDVENISIWLDAAGVHAPLPPVTFPKLQAGDETRHYDVVVVGGGIFGVTTAHLLKKEGKKVALLEGRTIGSGTTSFSTSKLSAQQGPVYSSIVSEHNKEAAKTYYDLNIAGIRLVKKIIDELKIKCEYEPRSHSMWTSMPDNIAKVQSEYETCLALGIDAKLVRGEELAEELPPSLNPKLAVRFEDQAAFNSFQFCKGVAEKIPGNGCDVFEMSRVTNVSGFPVSPGTPHELHLEENGAKVTADNVVLATGLPIMDRSLHFAVLEPARSKCIAVTVKDGGRTLRNMWINCDQPKRSMRASGKDGNIVVVSGEGFPMGEVTDTEQAYQKLESWAREHFDVKEVVARWSAMDYYSADHIPYIGYLHTGVDSLFTATGFSKWGLAAGATGGAIVTDLICGRGNPFHDLVDARRWNLQSRFKGLASEGSHLAKHLVGDKVKHALLDHGRIEDLAPGQGAVVKANGESVGAYRNANGVVHAVKPICTHLGCDLVFNNGDRVWDCPCHGSQFGVDGEVIHGPACKPLEQLKNLQW